MVTRKGIHTKPKLTDVQMRRSELNRTFGNPDWLSNCTSYSVNGKWFIRDNNSNKVVETFNSEDEYFVWYYGILYDDM